MKMYRLIYKNNNHSSWSINKEWMFANALYFKAKVEVRDFPISINTNKKERITK